jgi:hypothetical protein
MENEGEINRRLKISTANNGHLLRKDKNHDYPMIIMVFSCGDAADGTAEKIAALEVYINLMVPYY